MRLIDADTIPWEGFPNDFGEYHEDYVEKRVVDKMPTIEARPVERGEWRLNKDGSGTCKQCGWTAKDVWDEDGWQNFCGQCGADMRGEDDG